MAYTSSPVSYSNSADCFPIACSTLVSVTVLAITFLVLGILGHPSVRVVPMASIGSEVMLGLGITAILTMIASVVRGIVRANV